jgi:sugar lactone lactonase YvrE
VRALRFVGERGRFSSNIFRGSRRGRAASSVASLERLENRTLLTGTISGTVFSDVNGDSVRSESEAGLEAIAVYLDIDGDGVSDADEPTAVTDSIGEYAFNVAAGDYVVRIVAPSGSRATSLPGTSEVLYGIDYQNDSLVRIDTNTGGVTTIGRYGATVSLTALVVTNSGEMFALASADGSFWRLDPRTGFPTFIGIAGRTVRACLAYDPAADVIYGVGALDTGATGLVRFDRTSGLATPIPGNANLEGAFSDTAWDPTEHRIVAFDNQNDRLWALDPATGDATFLAATSVPIASYGLAYNARLGFLLDRTSQGRLDRVNLATGQVTAGLSLSASIALDALTPGGPVFAYSVTVNEGSTAAGRDFGVQSLAAGIIAGTVFSDVDSDGHRGDGDPGLAGVTIYLDLNRNGSLDAGETSVITAADGSYRFEKVGPGEYDVRQIVPEGFRATTAGTGLGTFYSTDVTNDRLMKIDEATGLVTAVPLQPPSTSGVPNLQAIVATNDGSLYGLQGDLATDVLWKIDPRTGELTRIGVTNYNHAWGMAYDPQTDTIYALAYVNGYVRLGTVNAVTGVFTLIPGGNGVASSGSTGALTGTAGLAFDTDRRRILAYDFDDGECYAFSLDGSVQLLSQTTSQLGGGIAYDGDRFVMQRRSVGDLIALDPDAGTWNVIRPISQDFLEESLDYVAGTDSAYRINQLPAGAITARDIGDVPPSDIRGAVWNDLDRDGTRDVNEPGDGLSRRQPQRLV